MHIVSKFFFVCFSIAVSSCGDSQTSQRPEVLLDIRQIAGHTTTEVGKVLGEASKLEPVKDRRSGCTACPKFSYKNGAVEVVYISGKADWITVNTRSGTYGPESIGYLGLPITDKYTQAPGAIRWRNYEGFVEIAAFPQADDKTIEYLYVQTVND